MNKLIAFFLILMLCLNATGFWHPGVYAATEPGIRITVDNRPVISDTEPFIENGRTYVPVRAVLEAYGVDAISWEVPYVIVKDGLTTLRIPVFECHIEKNGVRVLTDAPALIRNGRTCLPIRAVVEALGGRITWEADIRTVVITNPTSGDGTLPTRSIDQYAEQLEPAVEKNTGMGPEGISIVSDVGGFMEGSFSESALRGLREAEKKYGMIVYPLESANEASYILVLDTASKQKRALICAVGFMMSDAVEIAAKSYPEQRYAILDVTYGSDTLPNVTGITFKMNEASFLVGYIAGKMTKTNKVGFVGGVDFSLIREFEYGYEAGVKMANPRCEVISAYTGSFIDASAGKSYAEHIYGQGADIIYHAAGATGNGVIEAALERGKYVIGVDMDQSVLAPYNVLTSAIKRLDTTMFNVVGDLKSGKLPSGTSISYGLAEGSVDIAPTSNRLVPESILSEVEQIRKRIIAGEFDVPSTLEAYQTFVNDIPKQ